MIKLLWSLLWNCMKVLWHVSKLQYGDNQHCNVVFWYHMYLLAHSLVSLSVICDYKKQHKIDKQYHKKIECHNPYW